MSAYKLDIVEDINLYINIILKDNISSFIEHDFEIFEVGDYKIYSDGFLRIVLKVPIFKSEKSLYRLNSASFMRESDFINNLLNVEYIEDISVSGSNNLILHHHKDLLKYIKTDEFKALKVSTKAINKFNL